MTKSQIFLCLCLSFVAGVAVASFLVLPIAALWLLLVMGFTLFALGLNKAKPWKIQGLALVGLAAICFATGVYRFTAVSDLAGRNLDNSVGGMVEMTGTIFQEPVQKEKSQELIVKDGASENLILVRTKKYPSYFYGQRMVVSGLLKEPENFTKDFDYKNYLARDNIYYVMDFPLIDTRDGFKKDLYYYLYYLKSSFAENLNGVLPEPHASFLAGLILGERRSIPQNLLDDFRKTGTTHIVALSGYNITIVADSVMRFFGFLTLPFQASFWLAVAGIVMFTLLTGASASVVRAAIMGVLVLVARKEGRLYSVRNALVFAGAAMVFQNPKILRFDTAFQLSFLATLGLIYVSPITDEYFERLKNRFFYYLKPREKLYGIQPHKRGFLREVLISTLSAQFMVLPLLIYNFGSISLISPVTNLLVLAVIPSTMFWGFFTGVLGFISFFASTVFSWITWIFLQYEISVIEFFADFPLASVSISKISFFFVFLFYSVIGWRLWRFKAKP